MAIGFTLRKTDTVPRNTANALAKVETWVFCPALAFSSMAISFTPSSLISHSTNLAFAVIAVAVAMLLGIFLARFFVKEKSYELNIYRYALVFANLGYMAEPLIQSLYENNPTVLGDYKFFCLPFTVLIYVWGISALTPQGEEKTSALKRIFNFPMISLLAGMLVGITGMYGLLPDFIVKTLDTLKVCMGPVAMLIAGLTVANYDIKKLVLNKKVYAASALRLILLPTCLVSIAIGARAALNSLFSLDIGAAPIYFTFFATAMPLGMNTVVFPEAYGGDPEPGASMALISSTLAILTVPLAYMLLNLIIPCPF